eukprot:29380-Pelagococcus_subviridis.AAC.6
MLQVVELRPELAHVAFQGEDARAAAGRGLGRGRALGFLLRGHGERGRRVGEWSERGSFRAARTF